MYSIELDGLSSQERMASQEYYNVNCTVYMDLIAQFALTLTSTCLG
jgi:hypothetical protein